MSEVYYSVTGRSASYATVGAVYNPSRRYYAYGAIAVYPVTGSIARFTGPGITPTSRAGANAFAGIGAPVATGQKEIENSAAFVGVTAFDSEGTGTVLGVATFTAVGAMTGSFELDKSGVSEFTGVGVIEVAYSGDKSSTATFVGVGVMNCLGSSGLVAEGNATFVGIGAPAGAGEKDTSVTAEFIGIGNFAETGTAQLDASGTATFVGVGAPAAAGGRSAESSATFVGVGAPAATFTAVHDLVTSYVTTSTAGSVTGGTVTYTSISIGAAPSTGFDRYIVAISGWKDGSTSTPSLNSATVNGASAVVVGDETGSSSSRSNVGMIIYGPINTGTTATIAFTWSTSPGSFEGCSVYQIIADQDGAFSTTAYAVAGDTSSGVGADPATTINCPAGGCIIGGSMSVNGGPVSWSGITEDAETDLDSDDDLCVAHDDFSSAQTSLAVSVSYTTDTNGAMLLASWGP